MPPFIFKPNARQAGQAPPAAQKIIERPSTTIISKQEQAPPTEVRTSEFWQRRNRSVTVSNKYTASMEESNVSNHRDLLSMPLQSMPFHCKPGIYAPISLPYFSPDTHTGDPHTPVLEYLSGTSHYEGSETSPIIVQWPFLLPGPMGPRKLSELESGFMGEFEFFDDGSVDFVMASSENETEFRFTVKPGMAVRCAQHIMCNDEDEIFDLGQVAGRIIISPIFNEESNKEAIEQPSIHTEEISSDQCLP